MLGFTQIGNGIVSAGACLDLVPRRGASAGVRAHLGHFDVMVGGRVGESPGAPRRPFIRLTQARIVGRRAVGRSFPSGHTSQAFFMATLLAGYFHAGVWAVLPAVRHRAAGGHHTHVRRGALPAGCAGGGHPGQCLGPAGRDCLWVCIVKQDRQKRFKARKSETKHHTPKGVGTAPKDGPFATKNLAFALMTGPPLSAMLSL